MTIDQVYQQVRFLLRKNQQGSIRPTQFNSLWAAAERSAFNEYLGRPQADESKTATSAVALDKSQRMTDSLLPFVRTVPLTQLPDGTAILPLGYYYIDTITPQVYPNGIRKIKYIQHDAVNTILSSSIIAPDQNHIFYTEYPGKIKIWPNPAPALNCTYIASPVYGFWGYTLDPVSGMPVYAPTLSLDPQWYEMEINHIIDIVIGMFGLAMKDPSSEQYANLKLKTGD